jgi:serine/threonine-protein kinase
MSRFVAPAPADSAEAGPTPFGARRLRRASHGSSGGPVAGETTGSLPPELLREASNRLGWAGLIYAAGYTLAYWAPFFIRRRTNPEMTFAELTHVFALLSIATGVLVFVLSRRARLSPARFLDFGLVFAVVGALGISLAEFWRGFPVIVSPLDYLGVPWECVWILIIPFLAPNTPRRILITSLAEASTGPLVVAFVAVVRGVTEGATPLSVATYFAFTTYLCAGIAYVISRVVYRFGVRLKHAQEVGSYVLLERLGSGGMGDVWVAKHRMLARPAAIKLIRPELLSLDPQSSERAIARFEREARATAALRSTHTVDVYDFGRTSDGSFYYVMELLEGLSLEVLVQRFGPQPPGRVVRLLRQVCHSLGEAHARGLIHRDVKPANIFTCRLGPDLDFVKVLDFGLVKDAQDPNMTQGGYAAGTPAYMAPEVSLGRGRVDARADLYAVGCVAHWLLTGQPVFPGETPIATALGHAQMPPTAPSANSPYPVPPELDAIVLACLAKSPSDRPPTAADLDERLRAVPDAGDWNDAAARDWWDRHLPEHPPGGASRPAGADAGTS